MLTKKELEQIRKQKQNIDDVKDEIIKRKQNIIKKYGQESYKNVLDGRARPPMLKAILEMPEDNEGNNG